MHVLLHAADQASYLTLNLGLVHTCGPSPVPRAVSETRELTSVPKGTKFQEW